MKSLELLIVAFTLGVITTASTFGSNRLNFTDNLVKDSNSTQLPESTRLKAERIDSMLLALYKNNQFNGSILVAENGKILYAKSYGWADFEHKDTLQLNTPMPIASITKQFTGMAIMMLKEKGLLNYDDNINKYLPEVEQQGVTIRHLLHHTSGLDFNGRPNHAGRIFRDMSKNAVKDGKIKIIDKNALLKVYSKKIPQPDFTPAGSKFMYSNGGYTLLGAIIERVSGMPYWEFLQKNIFEPLQMNNTFVLRPEAMKNRKIAFSYKMSVLKGLRRNSMYYDPDKPIKEYWLLDGDKHIYSTVEDMFKWDQALYTEKLVSQKTLAEAFQSGKLNDGSKTNYGFGWDVFSGKDTGIVEHTGRIEHYSCAFQRHTGKHYTTILLTNAHPMNLFMPWTGMIDVLENQPIHEKDVFREQNLFEKLTFKKFKKKLEIKYY